MSELNGIFGDDGFDPSTVAASDVLPAGEYRACVTGSIVGESKAGDKLIKLEITILQPQTANGRKLWLNLNVAHPKDNVKAIALRQLKQICEACGIARLVDLGALHNKAFNCTVAVRDSGEYGLQNDIKKFSKPGAATSPAATQSPASTGSDEARPF
jgi:hypothetical protein